MYVYLHYTMILCAATIFKIARQTEAFTIIYKITLA